MDSRARASLRADRISVEAADSMFGRYVHATWADPGDPLLPAARIWYFAGSLAHALERHYPSGTGEIIVQLGTPHAPEHARGDERFPPVCTSGIATRHFAVMAPGGGCRVVGMVLDPATLYAALGTPLAGMSDVTLDLHAVIGPAAAELADRCADTHEPAAVVTAARDWLRARVCRTRKLDAGVAYALARLRATRGKISIAALEAQTGIAGPRLARRFAAALGTTPKRLGRILRFHTALEAIRNDVGPNLGAIALGAGYYDQAHMHLDFNEFCDRTPAEFARALHYPSGLSVAEHAVSEFSKTA